MNIYEALIKVNFSVFANSKINFFVVLFSFASFSSWKDLNLMRMRLDMWEGKCMHDILLCIIQ